ncbi:unnamed protein product [Phytophthora fragariaefolia]|uniref:Unnamed protein product n=1 Tax=Phytophthora fragariaefolia TaxID=1490495 RepID=A0A9W6WKU9_9STRA|nr:unnamed protein product [Phytophthora fragariaefolia]
MYNVDETAINFDMPPARMWAGRGRRDAARIANTSKHTGHTTRKKLPILFVLRGKLGGRIETSEFEKYPEGHFYTVEENAWIDAVTWRFYRVVAEVANATVVSLPANSTAACQPLDDGVMGPLKVKLRSNWSGITGGSAKEKRLRAVRATIAAWDAIPESTVIRSFKAAIPQYPEISI